MQLKYLETLLPPSDGAAKITDFAWSPNNAKLAVVGVERVITIYDEHGEKRDKFSTKPASSDGQKNYVVRAIAWSPDSCKLAVAQSDKIVFVYRLATSEDKAAGWGEKKAIVNKFNQHEQVTTMLWPSSYPNNVIIGLADGKVRVGNSKTNKSQTLYPTGSYVVSLACSPDGTGFVSGHADGKIFQFLFDDGNGEQRTGVLAKHSCPPYALVWAQDVLAAGSDKRLVVYDERGQIMQHFDYSNEEGEREATSAACSPSAQSAAFGSYDKIRIYNYNVRKRIWEESPPKIVPNLYTITALEWKMDGTRLAAGTLCGSVELFDCALKRSTYKGKFEFTYVGPSQVIVKKLSTGIRIVLKSHYNYEINKINVLGDDQFLVAYTTDTLLLGDLVSCRLSEVPWRGSGKEKFYFDNPNVCMIYNAGELSMIEYGMNDVLGSVRTENVNPSQLSVRINDRPRRDADNNLIESKLVAYLVDLQTIAILDMIEGVELPPVEHDCKIERLEMNETGRKILFRDKRRHLHLYDIESQEKQTILSYCTFNEWVPGSDVIVAQNRGNLCIWYNINAPDRVKSIPIKGEVEGIDRSDGGTDVLVDEGVTVASHPLDEGLIEFGTAVDDGDFQRACNFLERLEVTPESEAMWKTLGELCLKASEFFIAERCYAALGNVSKAAYLAQINDLANTDVDEHFQFDSPHVQAKLAALNKHFKLAESLMLEQGRTDDAIQMYQSMHKWDDAITVAEAKNHPEVETLKQNYESYLSQTHQEEKAGELKECQGDLHGALNLFMKAGIPARAGMLVSKHSELQGQEIIERVAAALISAGLEGKAGELFEMAKQNQRALDAYRKGHEYRKAVELCRIAFPAEVVNQEEAWADYLMAQHQMDAAINHYIEAGASEKAIQAAIASRQWNKASQIVEILDPETSAPFYEAIADHYCEVQEFELAEGCYVKANNAKKAIDMYIKNSQWESAHTLATSHMNKEDVADLYIAQAEVLEAKFAYKEAEKLYLTIENPEMAINMYKKAKRLDDMIRLVKRFHPEHVEQTHMHLAAELAQDEKFREAEKHYVLANSAVRAIQMYSQRDMWDDAYRVAKSKGTQKDATRVAYLWARSLGGDSAIKLLTKFGVVEEAIDIACDAHEQGFDFAFELAKAVAKSKIPDVHFKKAMWLEDETKFAEAEAEFIKAGKPREAVLMYVDAQDWDSAQRVAEQHDQTSTVDILQAQGRLAFVAKNYQQAEAFLLRGGLAEEAIHHYKEAGMWDDVIRLAKEYLPNKLQKYQQLRAELDDGVAGFGGPTPAGGAGDAAMQLKAEARQQEDTSNFNGAIDKYLQITADSSSDIDFLEECWEKACHLASKFVPNREVHVVTVVSERLIGVRRHEAAADLYIGVDMAKDAIDACMAGGAWPKARQLAREYMPGYTAEVEQRYTVTLKEGGDKTDASELLNVDTVAGLDMLASRGQWQKCLKEAEQHGGGILNKYAANFAAQLCQQQQPLDALNVFVKYGAPAKEVNYNVYRKIANDMFALKTDMVAYKDWASLRDILMALTQDQQRDGSPHLAEFSKLLTIVHFFTMRSACKDVGALKEIETKLSISLLRYTEIVPADKAFYEAGWACSQTGWENMAFVFLNRYLDLSEAIEDGDLSGLDNLDFVGTDVPFEIPLPEYQHLDEDKREEVREYVLSVSMDQTADAVLQKDARGTYVGSLSCQNTSREYQPCIVTGYPVLNTPVQFGSKTANKEDWNRFIMATKTTGSPVLKDAMQFMAAWCGTDAASGSYAFK